jgi:hypothetical protein
MAQEFDAYGGVATAAVAAGTAADTVISPAPGRLCKVLVTTLGTNAMQIFDNASAGSGRIIGQLAASAPVGTLLELSIPAALGITVKGSAQNPAVTISFN